MPNNYLIETEPSRAVTLGSTMETARNSTNPDAEPTYAGIYSQHDLIVDGITAVAGMAILVCILIAFVGDF